MAMRARSKSLHTRAVKVKVPGKHFSGLAPSEQQKAVYVCLRSVHEKPNFTLFHCPLSVGRRPTL
jgi:hypothetical protein